MKRFSSGPGISTGTGLRGPRLVVAQDDAVGAELAEILPEVVDEAVVVVENQDPDLP